MFSETCELEHSYSFLKSSRHYVASQEGSQRGPVKISIRSSKKPVNGLSVTQRKSPGPYQARDLAALHFCVCACLQDPGPLPATGHWVPRHQAGPSSHCPLSWEAPARCSRAPGRSSVRPGGTAPSERPSLAVIQNVNHSPLPSGISFLKPYPCSTSFMCDLVASVTTSPAGILPLWVGIVSAAL